MLVDESAIQDEHMKLISESYELRLHITYTNNVLDFLDRYVRAEAHSSDAELTYLRLIIRCFNDLAASLRLALFGYWQPCFSQVRDFFETYSLLDLFNVESASIQAWLVLDDKKRWRKFSPKKVRESLDKRDGHKLQKRDEAYGLLSKYASHPTPEGFGILAVNDLTHVGPFPSQKNLTAAFQELAKHSNEIARILWSSSLSRSEPRAELCNVCKSKSEIWFNGLKVIV